MEIRKIITKLLKMTSKIDFSQQDFYLQILQFESEAYELGIQKAKELLNSSTEILVNVHAKKICTTAYNYFKNKVTSTFTSKDLKFLVAVTLDSQERKFFTDLKQRVINILSNPTESQHSLKDKT